MAGSTLMFIWLLCMSVLLGVYSEPLTNIPADQMIRITVNNKKASRLSSLFLYLFVASFGSGTWGPVFGFTALKFSPLPSVVLQLVSALPLTGSSTLPWLCLCPQPLRTLLGVLYIIFLVFCFVMTFHVYFLFPGNCW